MRKQKRWLAQWLFLPILIVAVNVRGGRNLQCPAAHAAYGTAGRSGAGSVPADRNASRWGGPLCRGCRRRGLFARWALDTRIRIGAAYIRPAPPVRRGNTAIPPILFIAAPWPDGTVKNFSSVYVSALGADNIQIGENVIHIRFYTDIGDLTLTEMVIDNTARLNPVRMLFSGLCVAAVYLLWMLRKLVGQKPEYGFLIVGLTPRHLSGHGHARRHRAVLR